MKITTAQKFDVETTAEDGLGFKMPITIKTKLSNERVALVEVKDNTITVIGKRPGKTRLTLTAYHQGKRIKQTWRIIEVIKPVKVKINVGN